MADDFSIYTGQLKYKDIDFTFVFNGEELRLIPPEGKKREVRMEWLMKPLGKGAYTIGNPLYMEEPYLIGRCNETAKAMIFLTKQGNYIGNNNEVLFVKISAYIICKYDTNAIDRVSFSSPEINCIHPINQAFSYHANLETFSDDGIITITTKDFDATTTTMQEFTVDEKKVQVFFGVTRGVSTKIGEPPLSLNSSIMFEFEPTNDYSFIYRLWKIAKGFVQFLCYRKNVMLPEVELSAPYANGKHEKFATLYTLDVVAYTEPDTLKRGRFIKQHYIAGNEGKILSDIASNTIYMRHLPETYDSSRHKDVARFVMITAAFEWEFRRLYPDGVRKSAATIKAEKIATETIDGLLTSSSGKLKNRYKFLKGLIGENSLQAEIIQIGKDFDDIVGIFGKQLYQINNEKLIYSEMGRRLSKQRNNFAHGNLDKEFIGLSLLDLVFLEFILYAMQLKYYGVEDKNIQRAINDLFRRGFAL